MIGAKSFQFAAAVSFTVLFSACYLGGVHAIVKDAYFEEDNFNHL
jgi:hypothetical protein